MATEGCPGPPIQHWRTEVGCRASRDVQQTCCRTQHSQKSILAAIKPRDSRCPNTGGAWGHGRAGSVTQYVAESRETDGVGRAKHCSSRQSPSPAAKSYLSPTYNVTTPNEFPLSQRPPQHTHRSAFAVGDPFTHTTPWRLSTWPRTHRSTQWCRTDRTTRPCRRHTRSHWRRSRTRRRRPATGSAPRCTPTA